MIRPESQQLTNWSRTLEAQPNKPILALEGAKQMMLVLEFELQDGTKLHALYRPEETLGTTIDYRVPVPQELYRDVAYHEVDRLLGWNVSAPVIPWQLDPEDKGVLRPYWENVQTMQIYHFKPDQLQEVFWEKVAALDYICGVIDRTYNDFLILADNSTPHGKVVIDSGLSFVPELEFVTQQSLVREVLKGKALDEEVLDALSQLQPSQLEAALQPYVPNENIPWAVARLQKLLSEGKVL